jgi:hypothetical protein
MADKLFNAGLLILVIAFAQAILFKGPVIVTLPGLIVGILVLVALRYALTRLLKNKTGV